MTPDQFAAFYQDVRGYPPFPWQVALSARACADDWPRTLSLPTASGKTSAIDVAVFALAFQAGRPPGERTARMRTFFVVDRRIVVDEAWLHACRLRDALRAPCSPLVAEVARRLASLSADGDPLQVTVLRGGIHRDETWTRSPAQPVVVVSTVDQVGSRLLFRGYGIPARSRSIHAGLVGIDSRILLDEAHLSGPFEDTAAFVAAWQARAPRAGILPPPLVVTSMTATPQGSDRFGLTPGDRANAVLARRLSASKPAELVLAADLEATAASRAVAWAAEDLVVGVVVNRVATARAIFRKVREQLGDDRVVLLTGRMRGIDRDEVIAAHQPRMLATPGRAQGPPLVVVATQTVEVGANLDFDRLITEVAPLDALRQRFGRLNRLGNHAAPTPAVILTRPADVTGRKAGEDPVYGDRLAKMWTWATNVATSLEKGRAVVDMGIDALDDFLGADPGLRRALSSEPPTCPVALPAHVDAWAQTWPAPHADPAVAPYLHGPGAFDEADVQIVWRSDLQPSQAPLWSRIVAAAPPQVLEVLAVPRREALAWLLGRPAGAVADIPTTGEQDTDARATTPKGPVLRWGGPDDADLLDGEDALAQLKPGDTLVVPGAYGGIDPASRGWDPASTADVADRGNDGLPRALRLHPALAPAGARAEIVRLYAELDGDDLDRDARRDLREAIAALFGVDPHVRLTEYCPPGSRGGGWYLAALPRRQDEFADDDDSSQTGQLLSLESHSEDVRAWARVLARRVGSTPALARILEQAGWLHDIGKADPRMQAWLTEGEPKPEPVAKSGIRWQERRRNADALAASGYPRGARHELQSVAMILGRPEILASLDDADLALHLVGTHHGHGRGLPPVVHDPQPVAFRHRHGDVEFDTRSDHDLASLGSGWADRFWRLHRAYGPWGLAWLEAMLRRADHRASESGSPAADGGAA